MSNVNTVEVSSGNHQLKDESLDQSDLDLAEKPSEWSNEVEAEHLGKYIPVELIADESDTEGVDQNQPLSSEESEERSSFIGTQRREFDAMTNDLKHAKADGANDSEKRMKSTRMHRVSEKYRDSVVDRILAGKVTISELDQTDEYTEAELVCWIADRFKRMNQQLEDLRYRSNGRINECGPASGGFGPFGAR
jgi:hypothetical protein